MKAFDVCTPEELIQNLKATQVNMRRGLGTSVKISLLEMNQLGL
jgi:post-segregation antitoxin (ccd killing protein)